MLGVVIKLLNTKSLLTMPSKILPLCLKQTFPPIIWVSTESEGDEIKSRLPFTIFLTLRGSVVPKLIWSWEMDSFLSTETMRESHSLNFKVGYSLPCSVCLKWKRFWKVAWIQSNHLCTPSVKIQIMGGKVCLTCKGKTLLGVVKQLFVFNNKISHQ